LSGTGKFDKSVDLLYRHKLDDFLGNKNSCYTKGAKTKPKKISLNI